MHISNIGLAILGFSVYSTSETAKILDFIEKCCCSFLQEHYIYNLQNPHELPCYLENSILNYKQSESLQSLKSPLVFVSVKSCGRLPDCRVLSPPELALEVIWWNVAFCLLLVDLLLQKRKKKGRHWIAFWGLQEHLIQNHKAPKQYLCRLRLTSKIIQSKQRQIQLD